VVFICLRYVYCGTVKGVVLTVKKGKDCTQNCAYTSYCTAYMKFMQKCTLKSYN